MGDLYPVGTVEAKRGCCRRQRAGLDVPLLSQADQALGRIVEQVGKLVANIV
jgi:hypothetical protein